MPSYSKKLRAIAFRRRLVLGAVVAVLVILAAVPMAQMLSRGGWSLLKISFFALFVLLFVQVAFSTVVAAVGWWLLRSRPDPIQISGAIPMKDIPEELPATAIVMPIFNEDVNRVFQGLRTMIESLQKTGRGEAFDFFVLSDTSDSNCWIAEEKAWFELCKQVEGFGRVFYRKRRIQLHHKSGNIADFCRRWGASYRYMIVLDADSLMTGESLVRLVALMEQRPWTGIIQTMTRPVLGASLFQRMEQFSAFVYRPIFATGASFWQLGDSSFYGHNAIIRLRPFMRHCAMPELPELGPLGRRIMSHDTIEAALMRRGGYEVWQVCDLEGTYEEGPPHLLASLQRDRRWCHGNLQHVWFLFERGLRMSGRFNILTGIMAYANSPLWLLSLVLGVLTAVHEEKVRPGGSHGFLTSGVLYGCVMGFLFLPKILGALLIMRSPAKRKCYGGRIKVALNVTAETVYSMLLAPILMLFYTRFVIATLCGLKVAWKPQTRSDEHGPSWSAWIDVHGIHMVLAFAVVAWLVNRHPALLPWMLPVLAGPLLAIPFSRITASQRLGLRTRNAGWFVTPEEIAPPAELRSLEDPFLSPANPFFHAEKYANDYGLLQAILDPYINAIHVSLLRQRKETGLRTREYMALLADRMLLDGPYAISPGEKRTLLWDADAMFFMHQKLWGSPASHLHEWWQAAFRNYVESGALSVRRNVNV